MASSARVVVAASQWLAQRAASQRRPLAVRSLSSTAALADNEVALSILAAPVTAVDKGSKSPAGVEGVGLVTAVGAKVKGLAVHDWVVPTSGGVPTFRASAKAKETDLVKVPSDIPVEYAASMGTAVMALRLLAGTKEGDFVIQANADSPVGLAVVQVAEARGVGTINIVADGPGYFERAGLIKDLGGDVVVTDAYAASNPGFAKILGEMPKPKIGLAASDAGAVLLGKSGAKVMNYGTAVGAESPLKKATAAEIAEASGLFQSGALHMWVERHPLSDLSMALCEAQAPFKTRQVVVVANEAPAPKLDVGKLTAEFESAFRKLKA